MDKWLSYLAWVYDYNFAHSLQYLKEHDCINKVIDRLDYLVKRYDIDINPDFIGTLSSARFVFNCSFRPLFLINSAIAFAFRFLFTVVFKFLFSKPKKDTINNELQNTEGGAIQ